MATQELLACTMCFSYSQFMVFDAAERLPGCAWRDEHDAQGFARRETTVNFTTPLEFGEADLAVRLGEMSDLASYDRAVGVSLRCASSKLCVEGPEEGPNERWVSIPPGMYWIIAAQKIMAENRLRIDLYLRSVEQLAPSAILRADSSMRSVQVLDDSAEPVRV